MERSAIRDLVLAAGVGLLLGANMAWGYLALTQAREQLTRDLASPAPVALLDLGRSRSSTATDSTPP